MVYNFFFLQINALTSLLYGGIKILFIFEVVCL